MTFLHFCCILLVAQINSDTTYGRRLHKGINTRRCPPKYGGSHLSEEERRGEEKRTQLLPIAECEIGNMSYHDLLEWDLGSLATKKVTPQFWFSSSLPLLLLPKPHD